MRPVRYRDKYGVNQTATLEVRDGIVILELPDRIECAQPPRAALSTGERGVQGRPEDPKYGVNGSSPREGREAVAVRQNYARRTIAYVIYTRTLSATASASAGRSTTFSKRRRRCDALSKRQDGCVPNWLSRRQS
jgi:hypothetical protein